MGKKVFITTKELCERLKVSRQYIHECRQKGMPVEVDVPNGVKRYDLKKVMAWMNSRSGKTGRPVYYK